MDPNFTTGGHEKTRSRIYGWCLYLQYNTLPPVQLFNYQVLNLVHKVVYSPHLLPSIFHNYFTLTSSIHGYETRYNKLCLLRVNTRFGQRIFRYKGSQLWNRLPSNLTNCTALQPFRKKTKIVVVLWPDVMYCNELFLDICHIDYYILNQTVHIV